MSAGAALARLDALGDIECPVTGRALRLRRAWPRGAGHLLLEYLDGGAGGAGTTVAGQWFADGARLGAVARQTAVAAPAGAVAIVDGAGVVLQRDGADRRLDRLAAVLDGPGATLVVHRPERRAVVRRDRPEAVTYLKMVRPGRLPALVGTVEGLRTSAVISHDRQAGTIEHAALPGASLHQLLGDRASPEAVVLRAFHATGAAVRTLHQTAPPAGVRTHDAVAEAGVAARWADQALAHRVLAPATAERVRERSATVAAVLRRQASPRAAALIHRDLHDKQVLVSDSGDVGILDLDTLARGDPALDVANLVVHMELRALQGHCEARRRRRRRRFRRRLPPGSGVAGRAGRLCHCHSAAPGVRVRLPAPLELARRPPAGLRLTTRPVRVSVETWPSPW